MKNRRPYSEGPNSTLLYTQCIPQKHTVVRNLFFKLKCLRLGVCKLCVSQHSFEMKMMAEQEGCVVGDFLPLHPSLPEPLKGALKKIERHRDSVGKLLYQAADLKQ